jgi:hypothetical protein
LFAGIRDKTCDLFPVRSVDEGGVTKAGKRLLNIIKNNPRYYVHVFATFSLAFLITSSNCAMSFSPLFKENIQNNFKMDDFF